MEFMIVQVQWVIGMLGTKLGRVFGDDERGQTTAEYLGILVLVAAIIAALFVLDVPGKITKGIGDAITSITGHAPK